MEEFPTNDIILPLIKNVNRNHIYHNLAQLMIKLDKHCERTRAAYFKYEQLAEKIYGDSKDRDCTLDEYIKIRKLKYEWKVLFNKADIYHAEIREEYLRIFRTLI